MQPLETRLASNLPSIVPTIITVPILVVNVLFALFIALVGILFSADLVISLIYQFAMPTSAATAMASLLLLIVMSKWIVVFIAALADYTRWPVQYSHMRRMMRRQLLRLLHTCSPTRFPVTSRESKHAPDNRDLCRHLALFLIWFLCLLVSLSSELTGTWFFVVLTFSFTFANTVYDMRMNHVREPSKAITVYVLYRKVALDVTIASLVFALLTLTSVVGRDEWSVIGGGTPAVVVAYIFTLLAIGGLIAVRRLTPRGIYGWKRLHMRAPEVKILCAVDAVLLLIAMIITFATTGGAAGGTVAFILVAITAAQAAMIYHGGELHLDAAKHFDDDEPDSAEESGAEDRGRDMTTANAEAVEKNDNSEDAPLTLSVEDSIIKRRRRADTQPGVRRLAISIFIFFCSFVFALSLVDTSSDPRPQSCPGTMPGVNPNDGRYEACALTFPPTNLTTVDFVALTAISYMAYPNKREAVVTYFPGQNVFVDDELSSFDGGDKSFIAVNFTVIRFTRRNITVVSVRGSFTSIDWLQDLYIMSDSLAIQLGRAVLPLPLNDNVAESLVEFGGSFKFGMGSYTSKVEGVVTLARAKYPLDTIFMVGHSLGGFTANVVAAKMSARSVTMSPIGIGYTAKRYGFSRVNADQYVLSLLPEGDLVPKIDEQLGFTQHFVPDAKCLPENSFCHALFSTFDSIAQNCGDPLGRRIIFDTTSHC